MAELGDVENNGQSEGEGHRSGTKSIGEQVQKGIEKFDKEHGKKDEDKPEDEQEKSGRHHVRKVSKIRRVLSAIGAGFALISSVPTPQPTPTEVPHSDQLGTVQTLPKREAVSSPDFFDLSTQDLPPQPNGEVPTSLGTLPIEGFTVKVDPAKLNVPPDTIVRITAIEPKVDYNPKATDDSNFRHNDTLVIDPSNVGADKLPPPKGELYTTTPHVNEPTDLKMDKNLHEQIEVETFDKTGAPKTNDKYAETLNKPLADPNAIISEVNAPQAEKHVHETLDLFKPFLKQDVDFYMSKAQMPDNREGEYSEGVVKLSLPERRPIQGHDTTHETTVHELTHAAHDSLSQEQKDKLQKAHDRMGHNMRFKMPTVSERQSGYDLAQNEPVWGAITESTYYRMMNVETGNKLGHPSDDENEMFASTINVLRTYPDLFVEQYSHLRPNERLAVANTVLASVEAFKSLNPDQEALQKLLPNLPSVMNTLEHDPATQDIHSQLEALTE